MADDNAFGVAESSILIDSHAVPFIPERDIGSSSKYVSTCGPVLRASGRLLATSGLFAWVLFDGCDEPRTWPLAFLKLAGECR
ncbi:MAG: hypothetical protein WDN46_08060 [Methylocella sp.]